MNSKDRLFLRVIKNRTYLIHRTYIGNRPCDHSIHLDSIERDTLQAALRIKDELADQRIEVPCTNPLCKKTIPMTKKQLVEFFISSKKRYNMMVFPFCSTECRDDTLAQHGGGIPGSD